jgi:hypothetical protein
MLLEVSIDSLVDPLQMGWVTFREGDAILRAKVVRSKAGIPFISIPTVYRRGVQVQIYGYADKALWEAKQKALLSGFQEVVGDEYFLGH